MYIQPPIKYVKINSFIPHKCSFYNKHIFVLHAGRPWFDSVATRSPDGGEWYGQVRCAFTFQGALYLLLRWFSEDTAWGDDTLTQHGALRLVWERAPHIRDRNRSWDDPINGNYSVSMHG